MATSSTWVILVTLLGLSNIPLLWSWPDGAPCIHAAYESLNPLEAVEHQGGLQLTDPPFQIEVDRKCYWLNQPIGLTLKGNTTKTKFKGFAIQPIVWKGNKFGQRIGEFMRLDDNGSWQMQCFRKKDSVTHSHDEPKINMKMWWKNNDDDTQYVQFVATVVVNLKKFWVKSVLSPPIPPCKIEREIGPWAKPPIREPPPVNQFKMDTWRIFNHESAGTFPRSIASFAEEDGSFKASRPFVPPRPTMPSVLNLGQSQMPNAPTHEISGDVSMFRQPAAAPQTRPPPPSTTTPAPVIRVQTQPPQSFQQPQRFQPQTQPQQPQTHQRQRLTHIIPLPNMEMNRRAPSSSPSTPTLITIAPTRMISPQQQQLNRLMALNRQIAQRRQQQQQSFQQQRRFPQSGPVCADRDAPGRCFGWMSYCGHSAYMEINCRRTCRFC